MLGLFFSFESQSRGVGLPVKEQSVLADNLAPNPSFEPPASTEKLCDGEPVPHGWTCYRHQGNALFFWDSNFAYSGTHSVAILGQDEHTFAMWETYPLFPIEPEKQYYFSARVRADWISDKANIKLKFFDSLGRDLGSESSNYIYASTLSEPDDGWVLVNGSAVAPPPDAAQARLSARLHGVGLVRFDDVMLFSVPNTPFLTLDGDDEPDPVSPTGILTYVVTVTNTGGVSATSVRLTGTLDSRVSLHYSSTSLEADYALYDQDHVWSIDELARRGGRFVVTTVVSVNVETDLHIPLFSTFEVIADDVESKPLGITTHLSPNVDFELSNCRTSWAASGVAFDYVHTLTSTSNYPVSFTTGSSSLPVTPPGCGDATVRPVNIGPIPPGVTAPVTWTFAPTLGWPSDDCFVILSVRAVPNNLEEKRICHVSVVPESLDLTMASDFDNVCIGEELTYVLNYIYVGGMNTDDLRITFTLDGPAFVTSTIPSTAPVYDQTYVWPLAPSMVGSTGSITVVAIPSSTGVITATAQIATSEAASDPRVVTASVNAPTLAPSSCGPGYAVPGRAIEYYLVLTSTGQCSASYTTGAIVIPDDCGDATAIPKNTGLVGSPYTIPVTLTFTADSSPDLSRVCTPTLQMQTANISQTLPCKTFVISDELGLNGVSSPDPVRAGKKLTYTLYYTYVGGINAEYLYITSTVESTAVLSACPSALSAINQKACVWRIPIVRIGDTGSVTAAASIPGSFDADFVTNTIQIAANDAGAIKKLIITTEIIPPIFQVYLPLVLRCVPLSPPELGLTGDVAHSSYTLTWSAVNGATNYVLEEATSNDFSDAVEIYSGESASCTVSGKGSCRYYYRVRADRGEWCPGKWSNVVYADVLWEKEDNDLPDDANGPIISCHDYFGYPDDVEDFFKFIVNSSGRITIDLMNHTGNGVQLMLWYQFPEGPSDARCHIEDDSNDCQIIYDGEPGEYYIRIYTESGHNKNERYILHWSIQPHSHTQLTRLTTADELVVNMPDCGRR